MSKIIPVEDAVSLVQDGDVLALLPFTPMVFDPKPMNPARLALAWTLSRGRGRIGGLVIA